MSSQGVQSEERIIEGSKRPDGTFRKERRVRAGYVPQDEQPVYQSKGTLSTAEAVKKAVSKSAKKNAKRKEKKQNETQDASVIEAVSSLSVSDRPVVSDAPPGFHDRSSKEVAQLNTPQQTATPAQENGNAELSSGAPQDAEKQLRNLRKKIRQAEAIASKAKEGKQLSPEEQEKLQRLETWREEEAKLAQQCS